MADRTLYRFSARIQGKWERRGQMRKDRPIKADAIRLAANINGLRNRNEPPPCDAVKIVRVEEYDEEVVAV